MKKIFKNPIFMFILGGLIFGGIGIGVYAISASEITYNNATVADAINGLYQINSYQTDYSTEEKVVGTWIDGKPIYQKTIVLNSNVTLGINVYTYVFDAPINIDYLVSMNSSSNVFTFAYWNPVNVGQFASSYDGLNILTAGSTFTLQYTKTTDQVSS